MSEEKQFMCTARGEPCDCDKGGCTAKKDPQLVAFESIAASLQEIAYQLGRNRGKPRMP